MSNTSDAAYSTNRGDKNRFCKEGVFTSRDGYSDCEKSVVNIAGYGAMPLNSAFDAVGGCPRIENLLRKSPFGQISRSFSLNSHHYSPQTIEKSDSKWLSLATAPILGQPPRELPAPAGAGQGEEVVAAVRPLHALVRRLALLFLAVILMQGCVTTGTYPENFSSADTGLYNWVEQTLAPYLVDQLSRQPRFKGEPVLLVSMNGADVRPDIDELTRNVRSRVLDRLLHTPGTELVWRPTAQPWEHHRSSDRLRCNTASTARYFVGIDIAPSTGGKYQVSVRALDIGAANWVTGFGKTWRGGLTHSQQQALAARRTDEYLRGLRLLPFSAGETDLVAAYLARNLSCVLREQGAADYRVYVDTAAKDEPEMQKVLTLVSHNLARQQAVRITEDPQHAELILGGSLSELHGSLHQLWVKLRAKSPDVHPASLDTDAYLYLGQPVDNRVVVASIAPVPLPQRSHSQQATLLSKLRVLTADEARGCEGGVLHRLSSREAIGRGECFQVEFDLYQPAHVFVLSHQVNGSLTRLQPFDCQGHTDAGQWLVPRQSLRIAGQGGSAFRWARQPGIESLYAIAVADAGIARELAVHLDDLPDGCALPRGNSARAERYEDWLAQLDMLVDRYSGSLDWQAVRVRHAQP